MKPILLAGLVFCIFSASAYSQCNTSNNLALGKLATASSSENGGTSPDKAVDGNPATRWSSNFSDPQYITVDLGATTAVCEVVLLWEAAYATSFLIEISPDNTNWTTMATVTGNTSTTNTIPVSGNGRYVRMTGLSRASGFGYSLYEFKVFGTAATPSCSLNLALGQPSYESGQENIAFPSENAFDGDMSTRWSSAFADPQFLYVDLGGKYPLCSVDITWEAAYATAFRIDLSDDGINWVTEAEITGNTSLHNSIPVNGSARYVRMYGITRATGFGYSIWEMKVFGNSIVLPVKWISFTGKMDSRREARLDWVTAGESESGHYEIQRRTGAGADFTTIGILPSANNTHYSFTDRFPGKGTNYYRINRPAPDGHPSYSNTIAVEDEGNRRTASVYPNPAADLLKVKDPDQAIDFLRLYSPEGKMLQETCCIPAGQQVILRLDGYPKGIYLVQIITAKSAETRKIIKK